LGINYYQKDRGRAVAPPLGFTGHGWSLDIRPTSVTMPNLVAVGQMVRAYVGISTRKIAPSLQPFQITQGHRNWSGTYDFLLVIHGNYGPISYRFQDKRRHWSKTQIYLTLCLGLPLLLKVTPSEFC